MLSGRPGSSTAAASFVLVHSPSVGPGTWWPVAEWLRAEGYRAAVPSLAGVAEEERPVWELVAGRVAGPVADQGDGRPVIVAVHSNAGLFAPAIAAATRPAGLLFVDASIPPDAGAAEVVPARFLDELRSKATGGRLPR